MYIKVRFKDSNGDILTHVSRKVEYVMDVWKAIISTYESEEIDVGLSFESHRSLLLKMQFFSLYTVYLQGFSLESELPMHGK